MEFRPCFFWRHQHVVKSTVNWRSLIERIKVTKWGRTTIYRRYLVTNRFITGCSWHYWTAWKAIPTKLARLIWRIGDWRSIGLWYYYFSLRKWVVKSTKFLITMSESAVLAKFADSFKIKVLASHCLVVVIWIVHHFKLNVNGQRLQVINRKKHTSSRLRSSCSPWAKWHLVPTWQDPVWIKCLHSWVLYRLLN